MFDEDRTAWNVHTFSQWDESVAPMRLMLVKVSHSVTCNVGLLITDLRGNAALYSCASLHML